MSENQSTKRYVTEISAIIGTGIAMCSLMIVGFFNIQGQINEQGKRVDQINARADQLYVEFITLIKEVHGVR